MEILSTGEKIKRARVYKGITLKELCKGEISISKMSCIENGKMKAERDILDYVAKILNIDVNYLLKDVNEQILDNLKVIKEKLYEDEDMEKKINLNLNAALEYEYYDMAFELIHIVFNFYLANQMYEKIQLIVPQYFDLYQRNNNDENTVIYFKDMAQYFLQNSEINEAITYYHRLRQYLTSKESVDKKLYTILCFNEGICYSKISEYDKAYKLLNEAVKNISFIEDDVTKGKIYHAFATVCIKIEKISQEKYIKNAYEYQKGNPLVRALAMGEYADAYFSVKKVDEALKEIKEGVSLFPKHNSEHYVQYLNKCLKLLIDNEQYDYAYEIVEESLALAIETDSVKLIEKAYYLKAIILEKQNNYMGAEIFMNLSMDALFKFGTKDEKYQRYLDVANLYYILGETKESLKYFNLALNLKEKM